MTALAVMQHRTRSAIISGLDVLGSVFPAQGDRIWCLHGVLPEESWSDEPLGMSISPAHLRFLLDLGDALGVLFVSTREILEHPVGGQCPRWSLTFDDGSASFLDHAFGILSQASVHATILPCTDYAAGSSGRWPDYPNMGRSRPMTMAELRDVSNAGFDLMSHAHQHVNLAELDALAMSGGLKRSLETILLFPTGRPYIAYPFGTSSPEVRRVARSVGFRGALGVAPGPVQMRKSHESEIPEATRTVVSWATTKRIRAAAKGHDSLRRVIHECRRKSR